MQAILNTLSEQEYEKLTQNADILERDEKGPRVLALADGTILKLFKPKPLFSSATLFPYPLRFARNAKALQQRDVPTLTVIAVARIKHLNVTGVHYQPIPGRTLRSVGKDSHALPEEIITQFALFLAGLHDQGIYFRSFHLANVIVMDDGRLGLIDIADLWTRNRPLTFKERMRNFTRIYRYSDDIELLRSAGDTLFLDRYLDAVTVDTKDSWGDTLKDQQKELLRTRGTTKG